MKQDHAIHQRTLEYACAELDTLYRDFGISSQGFTSAQAEQSRSRYGENRISSRRADTVFYRLRRAFVNPFTVILFVLGILSFLTDVVLMPAYSRDITAPATIGCMLLISGVVRFVQELRAKRIADDLTEMVSTSVVVRRDGKWIRVPSEELVVGDKVRLAAGDRVPADIRLTAAQDLFISQSVLTGESTIVEKNAETIRGGQPRSYSEYPNLVFMGSSVTGGTGEGIVLAVGEDTVYGGFAVPDSRQKNRFDQGANSIAWVLIRFMVVLIPVVFIACGLTKGDWISAFLFALSVAVGLTPEMLSICAFAECGGEVLPLTEKVRRQILETVDALNDKGFRVLAIAQKSNPSPVDTFGPQEECDMVLLGYLAFLDPPKQSTAAAIRALKDHGVATKILTGDNDKVTRTICKQVGLKVRNMLLGSDLEGMNDEDLAKAAETTDVFAKLTPDQKARVVSVLRERGHTVGFMGDGINDAAAMKSADIGISVDTAVDVAKESADIILLEKDLMVLEQGIIEGRKTYANMIKYIKMTASSNFGNMFSVLAAAALLPFLPMMSVQLIFLNLIYDLSCTAIPWDNVDEEFIARPRKWDASSVGSFMVWLGPTSSIFDFTTYLFMYFVFCPLVVSKGVLFNDLPAHFHGMELAAMQARYIGLFQAGWFVESMWSQTLVIHMIRTPKLPFLQSRASAPLTFLTLTGIVVLTILPFTPVGTALGFVSLPAVYFAYLIPCILLYMALATSLKKAYVRHYGELL